jgi:hypothetical protein
VPLVLGGVLVVAALWAGAVALGLFEGTPPLPVAAPYSFDAAEGDGAPTLSGNAPDPETASSLAAAWTEVAGTAAPAGALTLATGMPDPDWPAHVADLLALAGTLDDWAVSVEDNDARLTGLVETLAARQALTDALAEWSTLSGMEVASDLIAGPRLLPPEDLRAALDGAADCGRLTLSGADGPYELGQTVVVTGEIAAEATAAALQARLRPLIGDRAVRIEAELLNPELCAIRAALPGVDPGGVSLRLGAGEGSEPNLTGIYRTGAYVVADLLLPEGWEDAHLWVTVVDNTGVAFHVVPNQNRTETSVGVLGTSEDGLRRIPLLGTLEQLRARPDLGGFALRVDDELYGKSEIVAILSDAPLFELRPSKESVAAFAEALSEATQSRPSTILGVTSRILDLRE